MSPLRTALLAQTAGTLIFLAIAKAVGIDLLSLPAPWALGQGVCSALVSFKLGAPRWWLPIHLVFLPLALSLNRLGIHPAVWLGGFFLLYLVFWRTDKSRVPLFLTNAKTAKALAALLPIEPCNCVDLGCGTGSLLQRLAQSRPDCRFVGIEHAPIPFFIAWLRSRHLDNMTVRRSDFWQTDLQPYQFLYAFLSPVPMSSLWEKASKEMNASSLVISNSFPIPDVPPSEEIEVADSRKTRLYCYRTPHANQLN